MRTPDWDRASRHLDAAVRGALLIEVCSLLDARAMSPGRALARRLPTLCAESGPAARIHTAGRNRLATNEVRSWWKQQTACRREGLEQGRAQRARRGGSIYLLAGHEAHALVVLPYLLIVACPLTHLLTRRGHGKASYGPGRYDR